MPEWEGIGGTRERPDVICPSVSWIAHVHVRSSGGTSGKAVQGGDAPHLKRACCCTQGPREGQTQTPKRSYSPQGTGAQHTHRRPHTRTAHGSSGKGTRRSPRGKGKHGPRAGGTIQSNTPAVRARPT